MEIIIVRHGLSDANKAGIVSGRLDTPLTKEGIAQAQDLSKRLTGLEIDTIYSSPLKRAKNTAKPIADKLGKEIKIDDRLVEVDWGSFEGKQNEVFEKKFGMNGREMLDTYSYDFSKWGGETSEEVRARIQDFLDELKTKPHKLVLIVCHGGIVRWLHYLITGEKITWQPNAEEIHLDSQ